MDRDSARKNRKRRRVKARKPAGQGFQRWAFTRQALTVALGQRLEWSG